MRRAVLMLLSIALASALEWNQIRANTLVTEVTSPNPRIETPLGAALPGGLATSVASSPTPLTRTATWPFDLFKPHRRPIYDSQSGPVTPHPAVARIIVPEQGATAYGSGTLIDVRDQYGIVVTNWHVVSDSRGVVEVVFPSGFRSQARPLKVDSDWDLAALVIWRPPIEPVAVATQPPRPGDLLTIHGYGQGQYRIATGRCTTYYAPRENFPTEMVELDVEARQGDSGGPIFNQHAELAGVLFGAGQGTTLGSFAPRVSCFLASLAPDIGQSKDAAQIAVADRPAPNVRPVPYPSSPWSPANAAFSNRATEVAQPSPLANAPHTASDGLATSVASNQPHTEPTSSTLSWQDIASHNWYDPVKSALALVGLAVISLRLVKAVR